MTPPSAYTLRSADLPQNHAHDFDVAPGPEVLARIGQTLNLTELRKLRLTGQIKAQGRQDFALSGMLGATIVQPCGATLEPVVTRIDAPVARLFTANFEEPDTDEQEMPEDDSVEALGPWIDLLAIATEALSLNVPPYPRKQDASHVEAQFTAPGVTPMTNEAARPFAGLAALRDKLNDR